MFEPLVSVRLRRFIECSGVLPTTQFAYQKGLSTCDALLCLFHTLKSSLESEQEARIVQVDFSAAFTMGNDKGILYKLWSMDIWGSVLSVFTQFLSNNHSTLWWMVVWVNWLTLCQDCRRAVFWARYCFSCTLQSIFPFWKINWSVMLMTTLMTVMPSPGVRVTVSESLINDHGRVSEWCDLWGMRLNASKTKTMVISRSHTMQPQSFPLAIGGTVLKESNDLVILGVTFDSKKTFEKHLGLVSRAASQRLGILKSWLVFHDRSLLGR